MSELSPPVIVCAAIMDVTGRVVCGPRHFDRTMHSTLSNFMSYMTPWEQGFVDQHGTYYNRQDAWVIAERNGQIKRVIDHAIGTLYSENLY